MRTQTDQLTTVRAKAYPPTPQPRKRVSETEDRAQPERDGCTFPDDNPQDQARS